MTDEPDDWSPSWAVDTITGAPSRLRRALVSYMSAALAGVVYSVLALTALYLLSGYPKLDLSAEELSAWFDDDAHRARLLTGLSLVAISAIAFLWFIAVIRRRIGDHEDRLFGTVFLGSGIAFVGVWMVAGAALAAPAIATTKLGAASVDAASASLASGLGWGLILAVAPRLQAVFVFTTSTVILRSEILPRWLAIFGYVIGVALFAMPLVLTPMGVGFPVWVLVVSIVIITRGRAAA